MDVLSTPPDYQNFLEKYLLPNRPCLIRGALIDDWAAFQIWTSTHDEVSYPNLAKLKNSYGHLAVSCIESEAGDVLSTASSDGYSSTRVCMPFSEVIERWERSLSATGPKQSSKKLYVKDWHLPKIVEGADDQPCSFYSTPEIFQDDWMNAYYIGRTSDDFRFVYIGQGGTYTALHSDVYASYSWSANVLGQKRWNLYPPGKSNPITIIQSEREVIFVPSGWKHEVENLSPLVISINHNWCNSVNLPFVYDALAQDVEDVEASISDVKELLQRKPRSLSDVIWQSEWIQVVQDMVRQHAGWDWTTFWRMVHFVILDKFGSSANSVKVRSVVDDPLAPSREFITQQVQYCISKFENRTEHEYVEELKTLLSEIKLSLKT
ncbi:hypothetical protein DFH28DRAFT_890519 [Melampsora americana]|nr:hypothetical protein DFH28DRAFT_890519 [Melampsora americana]